MPSLTVDDPLSTDALLQAWYAAPEHRRRRCLEELIQADEPVHYCDGTMTITEAAKRASVSRPTIYRAIATGILRAAPLYEGGHPRVREADFQAWLTGK